MALVWVQLLVRFETSRLLPWVKCHRLSIHSTMVVLQVAVRSTTLLIVVVSASHHLTVLNFEHLVLTISSLPSLWISQLPCQPSSTVH